MSVNATFSEPWTGTLSQLEWPDTPRLWLLALINIPLLSIVVNALWQLIPRPKHQPPLVWHWIPFLGSAPAYGRDPVTFFRNCREKYGNCFTFILLGKRVTVTLGTQGNDFVLGGKHSQLAAEDVYSHLTTPIFGKDVVYDCPNEKFMEQKRFVKVSLTIDKFRSYVGMIEDELRDYLNTDSAFRTYQMNDINEWGAFPVLKTFSEITILSASRTLQGREIREGLTKDYAQVYSDLDHGFTPLHWMVPGLPLPSYRKRDAAHLKMSSFYQSLIRNRREHPEREHEDDVINSLMQQKYRDGTPLLDHEIAHILIALLMAGQHTSSSSIAWTMLHIADRLDIQEALYKEQVEHFGTPDGGLRDMRYEDIRELKVLDAVVRETLRLHPPIHSIMRQAHTDIPVPATLAAPSEDVKYVVPKGDIVLASPLVSQVDPAVWDEPEKWEPLRWYDEKGVAAQANKQYNEGEKVDFGFGLVSKGTVSPYLPFGAGRHRCIGEQFAYLQISTIITALIRRMEFRIEGEFPKPDYTSMMVQPLPCQIMYRRRNFD
ncbi:lanosterol 14-alpha-demethylase [Dichomitus squalens]|uniref:Lanosterol 14-alpha-demethylase n=1 Tax=Dichomitus squalens TaxID=114155 RepID=A0A4Q9N1P2_9APHY|nr:lanosterol 14-alpha-demethylase [Dichomitus squalens]TBU43764.1 lanosterol 14-alpha-demethylase [Dichomitus squalens]TBU55545.1 lanosterol 14-alpha-demethylase [Dichomitus squalens]